MKVEVLRHFKGERLFVCTNCGTWIRTDKYNENNETQCPFCGEWAVHVDSPRGRLFDKVYFTLSKASTDVDEILKYTKKIMDGVMP